MPPLASNYPLSTLRPQLRRALLDLVDPYTWDDATLTACLQQAAVEHGYAFPALVARRFNVTDGLQAFDVTTMALQAAEDDTTTSVNCQVVVVTRVELPTGTVLPEDPGQSSDPAGSRSARYKQGYRVRGGHLTFTNPAAGDEVGTGTLRIEWLQTYSMPDDSDPLNDIPWNGPGTDLPLLLLYAKRAAYQRLGEWQARDGIILQKTRAVNVESLIALCDAEIDRAVAVRRRRNVRGRTLDI
jgi:hypothetical protein